MWPRAIVTDGVEWSVCRYVSVCHDREPYKVSEPTEMPFEFLDLVGPTNHVLDESPDPPMGMV